MQRLPAAKEGWTAMTFSLINIELAKSMQNLAAIAASSSFSSSPSEEVRVQIMNDTKARVEKWLAHCNHVIPQHRLTLLCSRFLLRKLDFITKLQWSLLQSPSPYTHFVTENNLLEALEILEPRLCAEDSLLKQFEWSRKAYPQYHITMYVLLYLCIKPQGPNIDRAWEAVEFLFSHELWDESTVGFGSKLAVLAALKAKAEVVRERVRKLNTIGTHETSDCGSILVSREGTFEGDGFSNFLPTDMGRDALGLDNGMDEGQNWAAMIQGFQLDTPDVFWQ